MTQGVGILTVSVAWRQLSYTALKITRFGGSLRELAPHFLKLYSPVPSLSFEGGMGNHPIVLVLYFAALVSGTVLAGQDSVLSLKGIGFRSMD